MDAPLRLIAANPLDKLAKTIEALLVVASAPLTAAELAEAAGGAIRYRTTPLFERIFGLDSLSELPRLDDLGADGDAIRARLHAVAEKRTA